MLLLMLALTMDLTMEQILFRYDKIAMFSYDTNNNLSQVPREERKQAENLTSSDHCWPKTGAIIMGWSYLQGGHMAGYHSSEHCHW